MTKTLCFLSLAALLATGVATTPTMAAGSASGGDSANSSGANTNGVGSQSVTGTQLGSQQTGRPATGSAGTATSNQYGQAGAVGPTGSTQPDATNPVRSNPSGGGNDHGSGTGGTSGR